MGNNASDPTRPPGEPPFVTYAAVPLKKPRLSSAAFFLALGAGAFLGPMVISSIMEEYVVVAVVIACVGATAVALLVRSAKTTGQVHAIALLVAFPILISPVCCIDTIDLFVQVPHDRGVYPTMRGLYLTTGATTACAYLIVHVAGALLGRTGRK